MPKRNYLLEAFNEVRKMTHSSSGQLDFNHWLLRLLAYIIDTVIIAVIVGVIWNFALLALIATNNFWLGIGFYWVTFPFLIGIIEVFYFVVLEIWIGATLGKKLLGFHVQMENGDKITASKSFMRNISKIYWPLLLLDWLLGVVTEGSDRRQKYSDRLAKTTVASITQPFTS